MKKAKEIFKSFPNEFVAEFTGTSLCNVQHPEFGKHKLTAQQVKYSEGEYKNAIYKNICDAIDLEAELVSEADKSEPIVNSPLVKMLAKFGVDGLHELNNWIKYPELMQIAEDLAKETQDLSILPEKVKQAVLGVDSKMPYKAQFVWEELGHILGFEPA